MMAEQSLQEEIAKIKKWIKRGRMLSVLKHTFYFIVLIGVVEGALMYASSLMSVL